MTDELSKTEMGGMFLYCGVMSFYIVYKVCRAQLHKSWQTVIGWVVCLHLSRSPMTVHAAGLQREQSWGSDSNAGKMDQTLSRVLTIKHP